MFLILYGRSGSGKKTQERLIEERLGFNRLVSYTTRPPQTGEVDGIDYHFVDEETMKRMYEDGELMECSQYDGYSYGSPRVTEDSGDVVASIELNGIKQIVRSLGGKFDAPDVCIIKLDCSLKTAMKRCPIQLGRVLYDEGIFSPDDTGYISFATINANLSVEEVFKQIQQYITSESKFLAVKCLQKYSCTQEETQMVEK